MMWVDLTSVLAHQPSNKPNQTKAHQINQRNKPTNQTKPSNQPHEYPGAAPLGLASLQGRLPSAAMSCSCSKTNIKTKPCYKNLGFENLLTNLCTSLRKIVTGLKLTHNFSNKMKQILFDFSLRSKSISLRPFFSPHKRKKDNFHFFFPNLKITSARVLSMVIGRPP